MDPLDAEAGGIQGTRALVSRVTEQTHFFLMLKGTDSSQVHSKRVSGTWLRQEDHSRSKPV